MQWYEVLLVAFALSLDAFAVSLAASTAGHVHDRRAAFRLSFHFGLFQFMMPILGWTLGTAIESTIAAVDHWVAFGLLAFVGGRMIYAATRPASQTRSDDPSRGVLLVILAIATSIDALAVGLSLAMLNTSVWTPSIVIGLVAGGMSVLAIVGGARLGRWLGTKAQLAGGLILLLIGVRILVAHMM
jgi:manganese efflux pump family protein